MSGQVFAVYVLTYALVCITPGPAVFFVTSQAVWRGRGAGVLAAAGVESANAIFWALSALGLAAIIAASALAFSIIKWVGVAYLAWLGVRAIAASFSASAGEAQEGRTQRHAYLDGLIVGLSNPKGLLFFLALLPQFIDPAGDAATQIVLLAGASVAISFVINSGCAVLADRVRGVLRLPGVQRWFDRGVGCAFLALAGAAALYRRS